MRHFILLAVCLLCCSFLSAQTIYEIQGQVSDSPFNGQEITTNGIVTGVAPEGFFLQDGAGAWNGIYVYEQDFVPEVGDEISITATVDEFFELTELVDVSDYEVLSSSNDLPEPTIVTTAGVNDESMEGVLATVENAECVNPDIGFGEFQLDDGSGTLSVDDLMYLFSAQMGNMYTITGVVTYSFEFFKLEPRNADDILNAAPLYFTELPEEFNIQTSSMTIVWETNANSNSILEWGLTMDFEIGSITQDESVTSHEVVLPALETATVYYIRVRSEDDENTTGDFDRVVCTSSESSGIIEVLFNHQVNTDEATTSDATYTDDITSDIITKIQGATSTLDITMYDTFEGTQDIFEAVNTAYDNGVQVRYITDEEPPNVELDWLDPSIPVLAGNDVGIMHDKFIVIDVGDTDNAWVISGSTNHTQGNLGWDFNNMVCIQDESLAIAFTMEFNEMWGSDGPDFDLDAALFSADKTDNTPHKFNIDGIDVEAYFSPSDGTAGQIAEVIEGTQDDIAFAIMAFTENSLGNALVAAHNSGVDVEGIIDYVEFNGSEFDFLLDAGIDVLDYINEDGSQWPEGPVLHHKYAIFDYEEGSENPAVVTGSHNWTASANSINDENTLIIYDHEIANWFYQEYSERKAEQLALSISKSEISSELLVYPNPSHTFITIEGISASAYSIFDAVGNIVQSGSAKGNIMTLDINHLASGVYRFVVPEDNQSAVLIVQ
jgi:phosphatidylserine/phosphatidylglycerophosphate/cardiolipin synthase-like enzyme